MSVAALIWACLFPVVPSASAQDLLPHMESCLDWSHADGQWGAVNYCNAPMTILFMALPGGRMVTQDIGPGERFASGGPEPVGTNAWMYTACAVGYSPSVRFAQDNADIIIPSHYHCVRQGRPDA